MTTFVDSIGRVRPQPRVRNDLAGRRVGMLTVVSFEFVAGRESSRVRAWRCVCDCGAVTMVGTSNLKAAKTRSCGCATRRMAIEGRTKHGHSKGGKRNHGTLEYATWTAMQTRCFCPTNPAFHNYGARGIIVCDRWRGPAGFTNFLADMGPRPAGMSIDRINNDGNYEPENCRWADRVTQRRNQRGFTLIEFNGEHLCMEDWAKRYGIGSLTLYHRIAKLGWPMRQALETPVRMGQKPSKFVELDGVRMSVADWAARYGRNMRLVHHRLAANWPLRLALETPPALGQRVMTRKVG